MLKRSHIFLKKENCLFDNTTEGTRYLQLGYNDKRYINLTSFFMMFNLHFIIVDSIWILFQNMALKFLLQC